MEAWGTPTLIFLHVENCPLRTYPKSRKRFSKLPDMPFWISLKIMPSCYTLSNTSEISRKTLLTLRPLSKEPYILWVIDNSWLMQESPILNPDWLEEMSLFSLRNWNISLNIDLSSIFPQICSSDTGRQALFQCQFVPFFVFSLEVYKLRDYILSTCVYWYYHDPALCLVLGFELL